MSWVQFSHACMHITLGLSEVSVWISHRLAIIGLQELNSSVKFTPATMTRSALCQPVSWEKLPALQRQPGLGNSKKSGHDCEKVGGPVTGNSLVFERIPGKRDTGQGGRHSISGIQQGSSVEFPLHGSHFRKQCMSW